MKLTAFVTPTARGFITYNGIGRDRNGVTPNDWLTELAPEMEKLTLRSLADRIKAIAVPRIAAARSDFHDNPRHSFVISAFEGRTPVMGIVSNYESLTLDHEEQLARSDMKIELIVPKPVTSGGVLVTGQHGPAAKRVMRKLSVALKAHKPPDSITRLMVKGIRDSAYAKDRKGGIGTSVALGVLPFGRDFRATTHILGGATLNEMPNFLTPQMSFADVLYGTREHFGGRYDPRTKRASFNEVPCAKCGNPIPEGYRRCSVCDALVTSAQLHH